MSDALKASKWATTRKKNAKRKVVSEKPFLPPENVVDIGKGDRIEETKTDDDIVVAALRKGKGVGFLKSKKPVVPKTKSASNKKQTLVKIKRVEVSEGPSTKGVTQEPERTGRIVEEPSSFSKIRKIQETALSLTIEERNLIIKSQKVRTERVFNITIHDEPRMIELIKYVEHQE